MKAYLKNYRQAPRKVRLIANLIRGKKVDRAIVLLSATDKKSTTPMVKLLQSAVANAKSAGAQTDDLTVKEIQVNEGIVFKRFKPRARGRASAIRKKTSHISVVLGGKNEKVKPKAEPKAKAKTKPAVKAETKKETYKKPDLYEVDRKGKEDKPAKKTEAKKPAVKKTVKK
jgi:large subunit ribosomal protein L22